MRTFIALVPPVHVRARLAELGSDIRRIDASLRCEEAAKLHFTLEFLGEKTDAWIESCRLGLTAPLASHASFTVSIRRIGFFPGRANPRIIWAGSHPDENAPLCALAEAVKHACTGLGHAPDPKPFHPHITLTRVKSRLASETIKHIEGIAWEPIEFECREIAIIKSTLAPTGSRYTTLHALPLSR